ncbi:hypothetical protein C8J56DRAFT_725665, partial [Mycena floridula]
MKAFIHALLGYKGTMNETDGGILGHVKAYYGCVEAQGRGTLHCHLLIWIEGGLNPDEIYKRIITEGDADFKERLVQFLEDTISTSIPPDPSPGRGEYHPSTVTGPPLIPNDDIAQKTANAKDLHLLGQLQAHTHSTTCYKYEAGVCRFDMDETNFRPVTVVDPSTGAICLRCLDGLVNDFNETILRCMRCNMDIKPVSSGKEAKAILFYITDYVTKSQLKAHVAYAALETAVRKLGEFNPTDDAVTQRGKRLLQRCAYQMISNQELSAPQVASYLLGFGDHFTSHEYTNLYWTSFEKHIDSCHHSEECY